ncbi:MAG: LCP family protein [Anaerolineales bacterium]|nr:LCP family protein [Anaerolineales bacterium]
MSLCFICLFFLSACSFSTYTPLPLATPVWVTVTPATVQTVTRTPFEPQDPPTPTPSPLPPTPTPVPTATRPPAPTAAPISSSGSISILLLGSDQRPGRGDFRTDVFLLLIIRPDSSLALVSFPRDLYVYMPALGKKERINAAYEFGGFSLVSQTLQYNFGFRPDYFVLTNFSGFRSIVDSLGGIDVQVGKELTDARSGYPDGYTVPVGIIHMDGETALWYVRSRKTTSDFDRLRRAQEVIIAIGQKLLTLQGLTRIPELYQTYKASVVTNLTLEDVLTLAPRLQGVNPNQVERYAITPPLVTNWNDPVDGRFLLLPNIPGIQSLLRQAFGLNP